VAVAEAEIEPMRRRATTAEGIAFCPETAACLAAVPRLLYEGAIRAGERIVVFNTAAAVKYLPSTAPELRLLSAKSSIDYAAL
jgi:threonine synthase